MAETSLVNVERLKDAGLVIALLRAKRLVIKAEVIDEVEQDTLYVDGVPLGAVHIDEHGAPWLGNRQRKALVRALNERLVRL